MEIAETPSFSKDWKRLNRKFHTLAEDLRVFKDIISQYPRGKSAKNSNVVRPLKGHPPFPPEVEIIKARLACKGLRDHSLRVIYAYWAGSADSRPKIHLLELYHKGRQANNDPERITDYLKSCAAGSK